MKVRHLNGEGELVEKEFDLMEGFRYVIYNGLSNRAKIQLNEGDKWDDSANVIAKFRTFFSPVDSEEDN